MKTEDTGAWKTES